jgi:hypothetical protein
MTRYAFMLSSNGTNAFGKLKFANNDADKMAAILSDLRYSFQIVRPTQPHDPYEIKREVDRVATSCHESDAFIFFFSGHGDLVGGELMLVLDKTIPGEITTYLPVSWIREARARCSAHDRLIILDCCHAEAGIGAKSGGSIDVAELGIETETDVMLLASRRLEVAREFRQLKGSFLTSAICSFLSEARTETVSLSRLMSYLHSAAITYNRNRRNSPKVPIPFLNGNQQGEFLFSTNSWPDLSRYVTILDGGQSSAVVSLAAATALATSFAAQGRPMQFSAAYLREKVRTVSEMEKNLGEVLSAAIFVLDQFGVPLEQVWPWTVADTEPPPEVGAAKRYTARGYRLQGLEEVRSHLELKRPVLASVLCHAANGWNQLERRGLITTPKTDDWITGGHAVVLVSNDSTGFRFANTWGREWGDEGFGTISTATAKILVDESSLWAVEGIVNH